MAETLASETARLQGPIRCRVCGATNGLTIRRVLKKPTTWTPYGGLATADVFGPPEKVELVGGLCRVCGGGSNG